MSRQAARTPINESAATTTAAAAPGAPSAPGTTTERRRWRYRCTTAKCAAATLFGSELPVEPAQRDGRLVCPLCAHPVERTEARGRAVGVELRHQGMAIIELVVEQGLGLVVGRWGGERAFPLDDLVEPSAVASISRRHVRLDVSPLGLWALDLGSANGTAVVFGPTRWTLTTDASKLVPVGAAIALPGAIELVPSTSAAFARPQALSIAELTSDDTMIERR